MRSEELRDKVAIITGGGRGIGKVIAGRLAREGARIVIAGLPPEEELQNTANEIDPDSSRVLPVAADLRQAGVVDQLFETTLAKFGTIDILVNNAGGGGLVHFLEESPATWDDTIGTNLRSTFLCMHRAAKTMVAEGRCGSIVNISSIGSARAHRTYSAYDAAKAGVEALTRSAALDLAPFRIRVNAVAPGAIETESSRKFPKQSRSLRAAPIPLGRIGESADVAGAVAFLCSEDASFITGQTLVVDGGMSAQLLPSEMDFPMPPSVLKLLAGRLR